MWYIYVMEYYSAIKRNKQRRCSLFPSLGSGPATWMELEMIILSEVSQTERQRPHDITYTWNLKI